MSDASSSPCRNRRRPGPPVAVLAVLLAILPLQDRRAAAQEPARPEVVIERLFEAPAVEAEWFAPDFLAQVPADRVAGLIASLEAGHGAFRSVSGEGHSFTVTLDRAEIPTSLVLDTKGRIAGLRFEAPVALGRGLQEHADRIAALPGRTSVFVTSGGEARISHNADVPLAVGSAAKLAVLKAVRDAVSDGRLSEDKVVRLDEARRSLPSGLLQDWPAGTPLTVASLLNLMISVSDNTATDALIHTVGREAVEAETPRNAPFPTTRELFVLKAAGNAPLRRSWTEGDEAARRGMLDEIAAARLPEAAQLATGPTVEVEWFLTARELCGLIGNLADDPALKINPGLAASQDWREIAYKGGSEAGVLNITSHLVDKSGKSHCVTASWNDTGAPLDDQKLVSAYRAILRELKAD